MNYSDGQKVQIGDVVMLDNSKGVVVCSISEGKYSKEYPESDWSYLKTGVIIDFEKYGLMHYEVLENDLVLINRKGGYGIEN